MDLVTSIFLGVIQGLTEFLPVSSSGHLVLFQNLFGYKDPELLFDVGLHLGTLFAVCLYFRSDLKLMIRETWSFAADLSHRRLTLSKLDTRPHASLTLWVFMGTLPTALIGLCFRRLLENLFGSVTTVGLMLLCTGMILTVTLLISKDYTKRNNVGFIAALAVGLAQGMAIIPGISRSGATIVCGMLFKLRRDLAARFAFLLSIPAIVGAMIIQLSALGSSQVSLLSWFAGFLSSVLVGLLALKMLMRMVQRGKLFFFAPYCWALGLFILWI